MSELYFNLVHAAEIQEDDVVKTLLYDAAHEISRLSDQVEELTESRNTVTVSVSLTYERVRGVISEAIRNVTGKDLEYVVEAVREKMEREGDDIGRT